MEMFADWEEVAVYLQAHQGWFCRCAQPMQVEPLGENGYVLTVGQFGALGFEVEPKIAVVLDPPIGRDYLMYTVPLPDGPTPGYEVDYQATMTLEQKNSDGLTGKVRRQFEKLGLTIPANITEVQ